MALNITNILQEDRKGRGQAVFHIIKDISNYHSPVINQWIFTLVLVSSCLKRLYCIYLS